MWAHDYRSDVVVLGRVCEQGKEEPEASKISLAMILSIDRSIHIVRHKW